MKRLSAHFFKTTETFRRRKALFYSVLAAAVIGFCLFLFIISVGRPYMGMDLVFKERDWEVADIDSSGLAKYNGIKPGDRPIEINGQPAHIFLQKYREIGIYYDTEIQDLSVIDDQGQVKTASTQNNFPFPPALTVQFTLIAVCLVFWVVGLFVFFKRPENKAAIILLLDSLLMGTLCCANIAGNIGFPGCVVLSIVCSVLGPWMLLHFFLVLPEERREAHSRPLVYLIYLPPLVTLALFPFYGWGAGQPLPGFRDFRSMEMVVGIIAVIVVVIMNYFQASSVRTRQQGKIVGISCLAALIPFFVLYLLPQMVIKQSLIPQGYSALFLVFIPVGMGVAVVTQKLMDIEFILRRGAIYVLVSVVMAAILSAAVFPVITFHASLNIFQQVIITLCLGGVATALFGPTRNWIELILDKYFYKDRYDYREIIQGFSSSVNKMSEVNDISRLYVGTVVHTLNLIAGCLMVKSQAGQLQVSTAEGIYTDPGRQKILMNLIARRNNLNEFPNSASLLDPELAYLIPLNSGGREIGILCLSQKVSRQEFNSDDVYLLQGLASVAATALNSALLVRDVSLRNTFVPIASHELRIPLTSILGYAELLLLREASEESRQKWLGKIITQGQKINTMVDDLLNVSRIQSGKISIKLEALRLDNFLEEKLSGIRESDQKHEFRLEVEEGLPEAYVDRDKFGQVVINLLNNAVKFSPGGGGITLAARLDSLRRRIVVSVKDEGIGIGREDRDTLFTTFHRIQRPETQGIRGSGLGLYIVKEWSQAMGGEVWLESEINKGATFYVAVQIAGTHQAQPQAPGQPPA